MKLLLKCIASTAYGFNNALLLKYCSSILLIILGFSKKIRIDVWKIFDQNTAIIGTRIVFFLISLRLPILTSLDYFFSPAQYFKYDSLLLLRSIIERSHLNTFEKKLHLASINSMLKEGCKDGSSTAQDYKFAQKNHLEQALAIVLHDSASLSAPKIKNKKSTKHFTTEDALYALDDLDKLFVNLDLSWFVISGTFLGAVREKGFLGHDYDIDVGIFEEELEGKFDNVTLLKLLSTPEFTVRSDQKPVFIKDGPLAKKSGKQPKYSLLIKLEHSSKIEIDIFIHYRWNEKLWHGSSIHLWHNTPFSIGNYELKGRKIKGPKDYDLYLRENYGNNWREPIKKFNSSLDTPNGLASPTDQAAIFFLKKIAQFKKGEDVITASRYLDLLVSSNFIIKNGSSIFYV